MDSSDQYPFFFSPPQEHHLMASSTSHGNMINDDLLENYSHDLFEFMLFDGGLADDDDLNLFREGVVFDNGHETGAYTNFHDQLQVDAISGGSPGLSLQVDDDDGDPAKVMTQTRRDRSKTLISERKRRGRMKEMLYQLRSLVPNITKMDKASIIADAVVYVKDLQSQAKKLEEEISMLESSSSSSKEEQVLLQVNSRSSYGTKATELEAMSSSTGNITVMGSKIEQVNAYEVGEGRFYVKVEGSLGDGGAAPSTSLYSAVESLSCFDLESSNFSIDCGRFMLVLTFKVGRDYFSYKEMNASSMKLWVMGALLNQGFQLMQTTNL